MANSLKAKASFRDPSGHIFFQDGVCYRQINKSYKTDYDRFIESGLYKILLDSNLIVSHEETDFQETTPHEAYKTIKPEMIPFISYPYEWSFSQLRDAALTTMRIARLALEADMILKDASAYNIQFHNGRPVFIDTLSFETYREGSPWVAYRQFCQHFLAPLALICHVDTRLSQLLRIYIDGLPLDLVSSLLPMQTRLKFSLLVHIHLHARSQKKYANKTVGSHRRVPRRSVMALFDSLEGAVKAMKWEPVGTEWADYYDETNYSKESFTIKEKHICDYLDTIKPRTMWDLGANTGHFSRLGSDRGIMTIAFDIDPSAVEKNYLFCREKNQTLCLPLLIDLTNPNPGLGWANEERMSLVDRGPVDCVMALALIHHLAITNNLPLDMVAEFFGKICRSLIIEFVPKSDSQVKKMLLTRKDIFPDYHQDGFESAFKGYFSTERIEKVGQSGRMLYLMRSHQS